MTHYFDEKNLSRWQALIRFIGDSVVAYSFGHPEYSTLSIRAEQPTLSSVSCRVRRRLFSITHSVSLEKRREKLACIMDRRDGSVHV